MANQSFLVNENGYSTILYQQEHSLLIETIKDFNGQIRPVEWETSLAMLTTFKNNINVDMYMLDATLLRVSSAELLSFLDKTFVPEIVGAGLKRIAIVRPHNVFGVLCLQALKTFRNDKLKIEIFETAEQASSWIIMEGK